MVIWEKQYGPDHPNVAFFWTECGRLFSKAGDHRTARALCQRALRVQEKVLPLDHPLVGITLYCAASQAAHVDDRRGAIELLLQALESGHLDGGDWELESNPDFASLQDTPDFQAFLARFERRKKDE